MNDGNKVGMFIMLFIALIVGLVLLQASAQNLDESLNSVSVINQSITFPADGVGLVLSNRYKVVSNIVSQNGSTSIDSGNWTINNNRLVGGSFAGAQIVGVGSYVDGVVVNVSYDAERLEYITDAGGRGIAALIIVFFAIALFMIAIFPALREKVFER